MKHEPTPLFIRVIIVILYLVFIGGMIAIALFPLSGCGKQTDYGYLNTDRRDLHKYQFWIDHYSKDTTKMGVRTLWEQRILPSGVNTYMGVPWFLNCDTDSIEHWYYKIDGIGYETKLQPTRIDTNWNNYQIK